MDTCVRCGAELGVGRFCLNCGHPIGEPAPAPVTTTSAGGPSAAPPAADPGAAAPSPEPTTLPVQAADPTAVPPVGAQAPAAVDPAAPERDPLPARESTWDPREDLLPYEEVDELDADDPVRGRAWIFWVVGAVLLVALVFVLLQAFGTDENDATDATGATTSESSAPAGGGSTESSEPDASEPGTKGVGKQTDLAAAATIEVPGTAPATTDFDGNLVAYEASQMNDGTPTTTWRIAGDATGQAVTLTLAEPSVVTRVGLVNGYAKKVAGVDWYPNNRRILSVTWGFDDGSTVEQSLAERPRMQMLEVPPVETSVVTITITSVTPPGSGSLGRDYTAISEVRITGKRAG